MKESKKNIEVEKNENISSKNRRENKPHSWRGTILFLLCILILRVFVVETIYVKGSSMEPNFQHGDWLFINKLATDFGEIEKDDIIICEMHIDNFAEKIIKRVIGVPGDEINIVLNSESEDIEYLLYINKELIEEPYIAEPMRQLSDLEYPYIVPEDSYFVMGDNRNASSDSRKASIGAVSKEDIMGEVVVRAYPFSSIGLI